MACFFAHLSRDPHSSAVMKARAPHVYRWTERMNLAGFVDGGFPEVPPTISPMTKSLKRSSRSCATCLLTMVRK